MAKDQTQLICPHCKNDNPLMFDANYVRRNLSAESSERVLVSFTCIVCSKNFKPKDMQENA